jgi:hypothetical protein
MDSGVCQGSNLIFSRALAPADDSSGVPHSSSGRSGLTCNESDHRLSNMRLYKFGSEFFRTTSDLPNHHHDRCLCVVIKQPKRIDEMGADNRIPSNADAGGLPDASGAKLANRLIGKGATAGNHADVALQVNEPGMIPILHFPGEIMPGQFGPMSRVFLVEMN